MYILFNISFKYNKPEIIYKIMKLMSSHFITF